MLLQQRLVEQCNEMRDLVEHENAMTMAALERISGRPRRRGALFGGGNAPRLGGFLWPLLVLFSVLIFAGGVARFDGRADVAPPSKGFGARRRQKAPKRQEAASSWFGKRQPEQKERTSRGWRVWRASTLLA